MGIHRGYLVKALCALMMVIAIATLPSPARADFAADWARFKPQFILPDGRVVDTSDNGSSRSDVQGTALLCAAAANDREAFNSIWTWTSANFDTDGDGLYASLWRPDRGIAGHEDSADGDILITWALIRADQTWHVPAYRLQALRSLHAIRARLMEERGGFLLLLPSETGFDGATASTINLGYWIFPAFKSFMALDHDQNWGRLAKDGARLIGAARFGSSQLPTDWIDVDNDGAVTSALALAPRFGPDAMRIPLYLAWGLDPGQKLDDLEAPFLTHWGHYDGTTMPAWLDVTTGNSATIPASRGYASVVAIARSAVANAVPSFPVLSKDMDYDTASLLLLAELSVNDRRQAR